jgi:hypothetical protein
MAGVDELVFIIKNDGAPETLDIRAHWIMKITYYSKTKNLKDNNNILQCTDDFWILKMKFLEI